MVSNCVPVISFPFDIHTVAFLLVLIVFRFFLIQLAPPLGPSFLDETIEIVV